MTSQAWRLIAVVAGAVFAGGLYLGFAAAVKVPALNGTVNCGSPFIASHYATDGTGSFIVAECDSRRSDRRTWAVVALLVGGIVGWYALNQATPETPVQAPAGSDE